jgi:ACS family glucarate transporter-like MFS transporter
MTLPYRFIVLAVAILAFMQTHVHRMAFAPLIPTFVSDLGLSYAAAGAIQTAYFWTYAAAQVPIGVMADRWGARRVMIVSMAVLAAGALAFAGSHSYLGLIGARMLVGLGAAAVWVPGMRLVTEWFPARERGRAAGLLSSGGGLGATFALVYVPWAASLWGWRMAYASLAALALLALAGVALALGTRDEAVSAPSAGQRALRRVLTTRALWPVNLLMLFLYGGYISFLTFLPAFLVRGLAFTETQAGLLTALITATTIVSWPLAGALSDRLGRRKPVYVTSQALSVVVCVVFALAVPHGGVALVIAAALAAGLFIGGMILPFVAVVEMFPPELSATATGVTNCACFIGGMVLPIVLGRVVDVTGSFAAAFLVAAAVQAIGLAFAAFVTEPRAGRYTAGRSAT